MNGKRPNLWWLACFSILLTLSGCGGTTTEVMTDPQIEQYRIVRIAVLPFTVEPPTVGQERGYAAPAPPPSAAEKVTDTFYRKLKSREGLDVVPSYQVQDVLSGVPETPLTTSQIRSIGERLGVGAVLVGTVQVYKERSGSAMGLERPEDAAEVGFVARLISVKDGATLWTGQYYERQRPATEDLTGFLERGPRYLTVDQLANSAVEHVLRRFPFGHPRKQESSVKP
jgi:TolB-like protein